MDQTGGNKEVNYTSDVPLPSQSLENPQTPQVQPSTDSLVEWQASEFIDHQKKATWFLLFIVAGTATLALMYLLTRNILSTVVVFMGGATFVLFAGKKPRTLSYSLEPTSMHIGDSVYSYDDFRTFSVVNDGALFSILLQPIKRFMPPLTIYFAPEDGEKIFDVLAAHIPHEARDNDPIERLMRRIRF